MIGQAEIPFLLIAAFPEFELRDEALDNPDLPYLVMAVLARQVVDTASRGALEVLPELFGAVEKGFESGDEEAQTLLGVGFLEDLQSAAVRAATPGGGFDPDVFVKWLGPRTGKVWHELLTGLKGDPPDLKTLVETLSRERDPRSMTKAELQKQRRAERRRKG